ncbi:MAG: PEGA domain-containing protein [Sandaracinus sp.]|nr:PEGA domain-containing protein [Sandaracinus sp.]
MATGPALEHPPPTGEAPPRGEAPAGEVSAAAEVRGGEASNEEPPEAPTVEVAEVVPTNGEVQTPPSSPASARGAETESRREVREAEHGPRMRPEETERAEEETPVEPPPEPAVETGWLSLDTTPWAMVSLDGRLLGHTPLIRLALPAGEHELVLENPERSIRRVYVVRIPAGQTVRRRIAL